MVNTVNTRTSQRHSRDQMIVQKSIVLRCTVQQCLQQILSPRLLDYVSWPMVSLLPIDPPVLPAQWQEEKYRMQLRLFGCIAFGEQTINISVACRNPDRIELRDNGYGSVISKWDHKITLQPAGDCVIYTDRIDIAAGILTPAVWAFAWLFYRHRQRRWKRLIDNGFIYPAK